MFRSFIALTLTAALVVTGFTTPAKAGNDDLTKALIGLAVIAGVAITIDNRNDRRRDVDGDRVHSRGQGHGHAYGHRHGRGHDRVTRPDRSLTVLPRRCLKRFDTERRTAYGFGARCLRRTVGHISAPERCERRGVNPRGRWTTFYPERCMVRQGYRISRN